MNLSQRFKAAVGILTGNLSPQSREMLAGIMPGGRGEPPKRGTEQYLDAYNTAPWLRSAAGKVAQAFSSVRWTLETGTNRQGKIIRCHDAQRGDYASRTKALARMKALGELKLIEEHPLLDILYRGNTMFTGIAIRRLLSIYLDIPGQAFWLKERNALGVPVSVWPIPTHWVVETPTPANPFYRISFRAWQRLVPETEILEFRDPNPLNPYGRGSGLAMSLGDELDTDEAAAKHARAFFYNRGRPDLVVSPAPGLTMDTEAMKVLESKWLEKSRRYAQAVVPMFMNGPVDVKEIGQTLRDMEFTTLREFERNTVQQTWGIPPEVMGIIDHSNRSTIDSADLIMARYVLTPRLEFVREILQERLAPEFDDRLVVSYESPVTDDKAQQLIAATAAPWSLKVNEWRHLAGQEPLTDPSGESHVVPFNLTTVANLDELANNTPAPVTGAPGTGGTGGVGQQGNQPNQQAA